MVARYQEIHGFLREAYLFERHTPDLSIPGDHFNSDGSPSYQSLIALELDLFHRVSPKRNDKKVVLSMNYFERREE
jgi:hypothetical protein